MYFDYINSPLGVLTIMADAEAVISLGFRENMDTKNGNELTKAAQGQLKEYFLGQRKIFDLPLKMEATNFQKAVWQALLTIPYGQTRSYRDIAEQVGSPKACRAVGASNKANPLPIIIPCHRVIEKSGSLGGFALGVTIKSWLLRHENDMIKSPC
jgi:methylated-DNA-[protein]-cysteine S-methyltransferase